MSDDEEHSYPPSIVSDDSASIASRRKQQRQSWSSSFNDALSVQVQGSSSRSALHNYKNGFASGHTADSVDLMQALRLVGDAEPRSPTSAFVPTSTATSSSPAYTHPRFSVDSDSILSSVADMRRASYVSSASMGSDRPLLDHRKTDETIPGIVRQGNDRIPIGQAFDWKGKRRMDEVNILT